MHLHNTFTGLVAVALLALAPTAPAAASTVLAASTALAPQTDGADDARQTWAVVPAAADGPDGRAQLEYVAQPGTAAEDHVAVRNFGTAPLTIALSAHAAASTQDGSFDLAAAEDASQGVGEWIALDADAVTIEPRSAVVVPFSIDIPADAEPGDHAGGIVAVNIVDGADGSSTQYRVGTRVHVRVAGAVHPSLAVDRIDGAFAAPLSPAPSGEIALDATLVNTGNIRLAPDAVARVSSLFGWWSSDLPLGDVPELLPDGAATASAVLEGVPALGPLWVTVDIPTATSSGQQLIETVQTRSVTIVVWAVPWVAVGAVVLLLVAAVVAVVNLRRRRAALSAE